MFAGLSIGLLWAVVVVQGIILWVLRKHYANGRLVLDQAGAERGLRPGTSAPIFTAFDLRSEGEFRSSSIQSRRTVLLFVNATCGVCDAVLAALANGTVSNLGEYVVYCDGSRRACRAKLGRLEGMIAVLAKGDSDVPSKFAVREVPSAVVIDSSGSVERYVPYLGFTAAAEWLASLEVS